MTSDLDSFVDGSVDDSAHVRSFAHSWCMGIRAANIGIFSSHNHLRSSTTHTFEQTHACALAA